MNDNNQIDIEALINQVREWGASKGITGPDGNGILIKQLDKSQEELNETRDAVVEFNFASGFLKCGPKSKIRKKIRAKLKDGIGDTMVTLILASELAGFTIEECLQTAYDVIKSRTGKMVGGQFVKDK